jgi:hypothetical protein
MGRASLLLNFGVNLPISLLIASLRYRRQKDGISFPEANWRHIVDHVVAGVRLTSPEERFRNRSLMVYTTTTEDVAAADDEDNFFVASFINSPLTSKCTWNDTPSGPESYANVWLAPTVPGLRHAAIVYGKRKIFVIQLG